MKQYTVLILSLLTAVLSSCTNSREDDTIYYVPKQVREIDKDIADAKVRTMYTLTYDSNKRIKTESDILYTASLFYSIDSSIDSVLVVMSAVAKEAEKAEAAKSETKEGEVKPPPPVTDSVKIKYTYSGDNITAKQYTYKSDATHNDITDVKIVLNGLLLPITYAVKTTEKRFTYDADSRLTAIEQYENSALAWTRRYSYDTIKSPYAEVPYYPAWYFAAYRHVSAVGLTVKSTVELSGSPAVVEYELSDFTLSDLHFMTKCTKTYYEKGKTRAVSYHLDYQKVVFD